MLVYRQSLKLSGTHNETIGFYRDNAQDFIKISTLFPERSTVLIPLESADQLIKILNQMMKTKERENEHQCYVFTPIGD